MNGSSVNGDSTMRSNEEDNYCRSNLIFSILARPRTVQYSHRLSLNVDKCHLYGKWFKWSNLDCFPNASLIGHPLPLVECQLLIGQVSASDWRRVTVWWQYGDHPLPLVNQSHAQQRWSSQITMFLTPGQGGIFWRTLSYTLLHTLSYTLLLLHSAAMLQPPCYDTFLSYILLTLLHPS